MQTVDLAQAIALSNLAKIEISKPDFNEQTGECTFWMQLRTGNATQSTTNRWDMLLRDNGLSHMVTRRIDVAVGLPLTAVERYVVVSQRFTATAYTDAAAAWDGAQTSNRQVAFKDHLYAAGHIHSSLAGT